MSNELSEKPEIIKVEGQPQALLKENIETYNYDGAIDPEARLEQATKCAKLLMHVMAGDKNPVVVGGSRYLKYENWCVIASFFGCSVKIIDSHYTTEFGSIGFQSTASLIRVSDGLEIGRADAICLKEEPNQKSKDLYALKSMSQTRACSRAIRLIFGWVAQLAGYQPTPADEITEEMLKAAEVKPQIKGLIVK